MTVAQFLIGYSIQLSQSEAVLYVLQNLREKDEDEPQSIAADSTGDIKTIHKVLVEVVLKPYLPLDTVNVSRGHELKVK